MRGRSAGWRVGAVILAVSAWVPAASVFAQQGTAAGQGAGDVQRRGRSDPAFSQPSLAPGVDYTVPTEPEIKQVLDRIREHFVRSTPYTIIDTTTGQPITDLATPTKTAGIDNRHGEFNDWTYSMGVVLAGMLHVAGVTGDEKFRAYALKNFDFIFDHLDYFRRQAQAFGAQSYGYRDRKSVV
jgi:hypothetical protein